MAVYTEVPADEAQTLAHELQLGDVQSLQGIQGGIENTNYFLSTDQGEYVLTLFERLSHAQLPFYLYLMKHLASQGIPVPDPVADRQVVRQADVEGRVTTVVPGVGYLIMAANSMWYRNLMASYSLVMVTAYLVRRIWALGRMRTYGAQQLAVA